MVFGADGDLYGTVEVRRREQPGSGVPFRPSGTRHASSQLRRNRRRQPRRRSAAGQRWVALRRDHVRGQPRRRSGFPNRCVGKLRDDPWSSTRRNAACPSAPLIEASDGLFYGTCAFRWRARERRHLPDGFLGRVDAPSRFFLQRWIGTQRPAAPGVGRRLLRHDVGRRRQHGRHCLPHGRGGRDHDSARLCRTRRQLSLCRARGSRRRAARDDRERRGQRHRDALSDLPRRREFRFLLQLRVRWRLLALLGSPPRFRRAVLRDRRRRRARALRRRIRRRRGRVVHHGPQARPQRRVESLRGPALRRRCYLWGRVHGRSEPGSVVPGGSAR